MLIVFDTCEHAVAPLAEGLLREAPQVRILVTSREPIRGEGEWIQRLSPLASPEAVRRLATWRAGSPPSPGNCGRPRASRDCAGRRGEPRRDTISWAPFLRGSPKDLEQEISCARRRCSRNGSAPSGLRSVTVDDRGWPRDDAPRSRRRHARNGKAATTPARLGSRGRHDLSAPPESADRLAATKIRKRSQGCSGRPSP